MKKLLIVGDSITAGFPGVKYVKILKKKLPGYKIKNGGRGGDTLNAIGARAQKLIPDHQPDIVVIQAGTNDVSLPIFSEREGRLWKRIVENKARAGVKSINDPENFMRFYSETINGMKDYEIEEIILTTIHCVGENPSSKANRQKEEYNRVIRELASEYNLRLADVGKEFDTLLKNELSSSYLMDRLDQLFLDAVSTVFEGFSDKLSKKRGLALTIDGLHLNRRGARIFADTICRILKMSNVGKVLRSE